LAILATNLSPLELRHPTLATKHRILQKDHIDRVESLLVPVIKEGEIVAERPSIEEMRRRLDQDIHDLDPGVLRLMNPHTYHVSLSRKLWDLKQSLIRETMKGIDD